MSGRSKTFNHIVTPQEAAERVAAGKNPCDSRDKTSKRELGVCYACFEPAVEGRVYCQAHLDSTNEQSRKYRKTAVARYKWSQRVAKRKGLDFELSFVEWLLEVQKPCTYCRLANDVVTGVGLDRLDNSRGYVSDNVVSCCVLCNKTRGAMYTPDEMAQIGVVVRKIRLAREKAAARMAA